MTISSNSIKQLFAKELAKCCFKKYECLPSNERFARDIHLSSKYSLKVSRETVRKWFKGETFPDLDHLLHLIEWLGLDMSKVFKPLDRSSDDYEISLNQLSAETNFMKQISSEQIDCFVGLLTSLKNSDLLKDRKYS